MRTKVLTSLVSGHRAYCQGVLILGFLGIVIALVVVFSVLGLAVWTFISVAIVGLVIGGLARLLLPHRFRPGWPATILLGWMGSIIGGFIGFHALNASRLPTILVEIGAAALLILLYSQTRPGQLRGSSRSNVSSWR